MRNFIALQALPRRAGQLSIPRRFWTRLGSASIPLPFRYEEPGSVREVLPLEEAEIRKVNGVEVIPYREGVLPVVRLASIRRLRRSTMPSRSSTSPTGVQGSVPRRKQTSDL